MSDRQVAFALPHRELQARGVMPTRLTHGGDVAAKDPRSRASTAGVATAKNLPTESASSADSTSPELEVEPVSPASNNVQTSCTFDPESFGAHCVNSDRANKLRKWMDHCDTKHRSCAHKALDPLFPDDMKIYLIDIPNLCLIQATTAETYVALSYVWGGVPQFRTIKSNLSDLLNQYSLRKIQNSIANVIRDAAAVVAEMQIQYLWVDSLCIIQDDATFKHSQISAMAVIYNRATATIIAASGKDANANLSMTGSNKEIWDLSREGTRGPELAILNKINKSCYNRRGWTYQERLLSRRRIYFYEGKVYFECGAGFYGEQSVLDLKEIPWSNTSHFKTVHPRIYDINIPSSKDQPNYRARLHRDIWPMHMNFDSWDIGFKFWREVVEEFSTKDLTFERDAFDACLGVFTAFETYSEWPILYGLPIPLFHIALLWIPIRGSSPSRRTGKQDHEQSEIDVFPSWSWIGWTGRVSLDHLTNGVSNDFSQLHELESRISRLDLVTPGCITALEGALTTPRDHYSDNSHPLNSPSANLIAATRAAHGFIRPALNFTGQEAPTYYYQDHHEIDFYSLPKSDITEVANLAKGYSFILIARADEDRNQALWRYPDPIEPQKIGYVYLLIVKWVVKIKGTGDVGGPGRATTAGAEKERVTPDASAAVEKSINDYVDESNSRDLKTCAGRIGVASMPERVWEAGGPKIHEFLLQ